MAAVVLTLRAALAALLLLFPGLSHATVSLAAYNVKLNETTVSGISSGAYMAVQFGVAHSAAVKGVGAIAGGPYYCAQDDVNTATGTAGEHHEQLGLVGIH